MSHGFGNIARDGRAKIERKIRKKLRRRYARGAVTLNLLALARQRVSVVAQSLRAETAGKDARIWIMITRLMHFGDGYAFGAI